MSDMATACSYRALLTSRVSVSNFYLHSVSPVAEHSACVSRLGSFACELGVIAPALLTGKLKL